MINSVMSQGIAGMQASQREMVKAADQVARAAMPVEETDAVAPVRDANTGGIDVATVKASAEPTRDVVEPLIEMRRQELLFTASAKTVSIADKTLGSLIDVTS